MADQPPSEFCPKCQLVQPTLECTEDSRTVRRYMMCGFPVESGLVLEGAEALGLPRPPEVKILCVDDDPFSLQLNGDILHFHGYKDLPHLAEALKPSAAETEQVHRVLLEPLRAHGKG